MLRFATLLLALSALPAAAQDVPTYSLTLITDNEGGGNANVVTDEGIVGGSVALFDAQGILDPSEAYLWRDGAIFWQGSLGPNSAGTADVNAAGDLIGVAAESGDGFNGEFRAFSRAGKGDPVGLPTLPLQPGYDLVSIGSGINDAGLLVGHARTDDPTWVNGSFNAYHAVVWTPDGAGSYAITDLGTIGGGYSRAVDINNAGVIAGAAVPDPDKSDDIIRAVRWTLNDDDEYEIEDLGVVSPGDTFSEAKAVNEKGQIMGEAFGPGNTLSPAIWEPDGTGRRYPVPEGVLDCTAADFNEDATVVGQCSDLGAGANRLQASVWIDETLYFLRDLVDDSAEGWTLQRASGINNLGWIVGVGQRQGFVDSEGRPENFGFLLKPAEPVSAEPSAEAEAFAVTAAPNPLGDGGTRLSFTLPETAEVKAEVFDVRGRRVAHLGEGVFGAGEHGLAWDGRDGSGRAVAPGVYIVRVAAGAERAALRVTVVR